VVWDHLAPFVVSAANDMLRDVQAEVQANPARRIVFLGRDGHSLAIAARALHPPLYDRHCSEVVLSRVIVEGALQDLERNSGKSFPEISDFRKVSAKVNENAVAGARLRLGDYLQRNRIPAGQPGSEITLIDTSFKGTIQECLSAIFPQTAFSGRYVFFGASPHDRHADTKRGYVLHLGAADSNGGRPLADLPDDPELTFACQDAVAAVEETLSGPLSTPEQWGEGDPVQQASAGAVPDGLNPLRVAHLYTDPGVRQAVQHINLVAVKQYADFRAQGRHRGELRVDAAMERARELGSQLRAWIRETDPDPRLARMLDSFVRRSDKAEVSRLSSAIRSAGLEGENVRRVWEMYGREPTLDNKRAFVARFPEPRNQPRVEPTSSGAADSNAGEARRGRSAGASQRPRRGSPLRRRDRGDFDRGYSR
jgi:hypothetical protein